MVEIPLLGITAIIGVSAMACQYALFRLAMQRAVSTSVMTGSDGGTRGAECVGCFEGDAHFKSGSVGGTREAECLGCFEECPVSIAACPRTPWQTRAVRAR